MNQNHPSQHSGITIENTLSMAVQNTNYRRNPLLLFVLAVCGAVGGVGTFLSMFPMRCNQTVLLTVLSVVFLGSAAMAYQPKRLLTLRLVLLSLCAGLIFLLWKPFSSGFVHVLNTIYKVIYLTEWDRYAVAPDLSESYCVTVFLCFAFIPILYLLCSSVIHYQNLFLCLIPTLPLSQIGFHYGVAANHGFAILLLAFWFGMAAVHMSNAGTYRGDVQNSFLRRGNTFFPISSMRFMVTERVGAAMICIVLVLCLLIGQVLELTGYQRSEYVKVLRSRAQEQIAMMMNGNSEESSKQWQSLWPKPKVHNDRIVTALGEEAKREFKDIALSGLTLSALPQGRIYLKYRIGEVYGDNSWSRPEETVYDAEIFSHFSEIGYYPQEFLYPNMPSGDEVTMTFENVTETLGQCVPYAVQEQDALQCLRDNAFSGFSNTYRIMQMQDFEQVLLHTQTMYAGDSAMLYSKCRSVNQAFFQNLTAQGEELFYTASPSEMPTDMERSMEALLLCANGYSEFVAQTDMQVPDTPAMQIVREAYAPFLDSYNADTADAADTIAFLRQLREEVCNHMTYTLSPGRTPPTEDFVEYFLLKNQKGFCMHYATAGVILARMAGIPARYCEGYMVDLAQSHSLKKHGDVYKLNVLDSNAHAWMEVYIAGWGWIPFEFTFVEEAQPVTTEVTEPATSVVTSVVTSYLPANTTITSTTMPATVQPVPMEQKNNNDIWRIVLCVLGSTLFIGGFVWLVRFRRILAQRRRERQFTQADRNEAVRCIYAYLCKLLTFCGADLQVQRTADIADSAAEICDKYLDEGEFADAVNLAAKAAFSSHSISDEEHERMLATARTLAAGVAGNVSRWDKFRLQYILRLL
ncbi:MAG: transglutaminase domain-containing protein [Ruminococcus sp.]|nr:transglutaminase domain-containing protein [Ruminococcus sp.]